MKLVASGSLVGTLCIPNVLIIPGVSIPRVYVWVEDVFISSATRSIQAQRVGGSSGAIQAAYSRAGQ